MRMGIMGDMGDIKLEDEERTRCEIWSRVMGYFRPVSQWNIGKQSEWADREMFKIPDWAK